MSPDLQHAIESVKLFAVAAGILSLFATVVSVWAVMRVTVARLVKDFASVKQTLGLEPVDGRICSAFPTRQECRLREERSDQRLSNAEEKLDDHEHRLTVVEARAGAKGVAG